MSFIFAIKLNSSNRILVIFHFDQYSCYLWICHDFGILIMWMGLNLKRYSFYHYVAFRGVSQMNYFKVQEHITS